MCYSCWDCYVKCERSIIILRRKKAGRVWYSIFSVWPFSTPQSVSVASIPLSVVGTPFHSLCFFLAVASISLSLALHLLTLWHTVPATNLWLWLALALCSLVPLWSLPSVANLLLWCYQLRILLLSVLQFQSLPLLALSLITDNSIVTSTFGAHIHVYYTYYSVGCVV